MLKLRGKLAPPDRPSMIRKNGSNCLDRANGSQKNLFIDCSEATREALQRQVARDGLRY